MHGDASRTEVGAISAALPVMLCGLTVNNMIPKAQSTQSNEPKNSVDDNTEQRIIITSNLGIESQNALTLLSASHANLIFTISSVSRCFALNSIYTFWEYWKFEGDIQHFVL